MLSLRQMALSAVCTAALLTAGCAQIPENSGSDPRDPWETMNRHTTEFNQTVDTYVVRPVAKGYERVMPQFARDRIHNFYMNLDEPANLMNNALQGKGEGALVSLFRFMINTTLGLGGMFDVAGSVGNQPVRDEDFGQTLAVWGVPTGPYFVIPFLGPSSVRDAAGMGVGYFSEPQTYTDGGWIEWGIWGAVGIDTRARLLPATDVLRDAVDPYVMAREGYFSMRNNAVWDGNPPFEFPKDEFDEDDAAQSDAAK